MDPQAPTTEALTNARRRLIRGSFAVPAVLAVHNGSALAATSNKFRCALNATTGSQTFPAATTTADSWTRVKVYQQDGKQYVSMTELIAIANARGLAFQVPSGTKKPSNTDGWVEYKSGGSYSYASVNDGFSPALTSPLLRTAALFAPDASTTPPKVLVKGFVQPEATSGFGMGAISASCWTSLL